VGGGASGGFGPGTFSVLVSRPFAPDLPCLHSKTRRRRSSGPLAITLTYSSTTGRLTQRSLPGGRVETFSYEPTTGRLATAEVSESDGWTDVAELLDLGLLVLVQHLGVAGQVPRSRFPRHSVRSRVNSTPTAAPPRWAAADTDVAPDPCMVSSKN